MKTAVMGEKSDAVRILVKVWKSLLLPRSEFTFLDTYLGPGCGSIWGILWISAKRGAAYPVASGVCLSCLTHQVV